MRNLRSFLGGTAMCIAAAIARPAGAAGEALKTDGIAYGRQFSAIWSGDFAASRMRRQSTEFGVLFNRYVYAYGEQCAAFLPANKVAITERKCVETVRRVNGYGVQVGVSSCSRWEDIPTGLFAEPTLYGTMLALQRGVESGMVENALHGGWSQALTDAKETTVALGDDFAKLLRMNRCDGAATRRFQDNLLRFAKGETGVVAPGGSAAALSRTRPAGVASEAAIARMVADAIGESARSWDFNRFVPGSVDEVTITKRDAAGRPLRAQGYYLFDGMNGRKVGKVDIVFVDGLPECLLFVDAPAQCRRTSRRVSNAFENGDYEKSN